MLRSQIQLSPSFFSHLTMFPSSMVGESAGISTFRGATPAGHTAASHTPSQTQIKLNPWRGLILHHRNGRFCSMPTWRMKYVTSNNHYSESMWFTSHCSVYIKVIIYVYRNDRAKHYWSDHNNRITFHVNEHSNETNTRLKDITHTWHHAFFH